MATRNFQEKKRSSSKEENAYPNHVTDTNGTSL